MLVGSACLPLTPVILLLVVLAASADLRLGATLRPPRPAPAPSWDTDGPRTLNWSYFEHFSWRARVTGAKSGDVSSPDRIVNFQMSLTRTAANGTEWSPLVLFDNASVAAAATSYTNHFLLPADSYSREAGDTFDFLSFSLGIGGKGAGPPPPHCMWGNLSNRVSVELEIRFITRGAGHAEPGNVHSGMMMLGGPTIRDCSAELGLLLGRNADGTPLLMTYREYNQYKYWSQFEGLPELVKNPKKIMLMDSFSGDGDEGSWRDGFSNLRKLGLRGIDTCPDAPLSPTQAEQVRLLVLNITGEELTTGGAFGGAQNR